MRDVPHTFSDVYMLCIGNPPSSPSSLDPETLIPASSEILTQHAAAATPRGSAWSAANTGDAVIVD